MSERDLDVVVFGATGVTGRRVAGYLAERASETELRWAAAGRDAGRVTGTLEELGVAAPETLVADVCDRPSLAGMASRARVVLNLVGPYTSHGRPVIEACVAGGAHYADLTGELPFVRGIIDDFDNAAQAAGVKLVQVCGFEALPPDLAILLAAERAREHGDESLVQVDVEVSFKPPPGLPRPSDGVSGGTFQSLSVVAAAPDAERLADPALLIADDTDAAEVRRVSPIVLAPRRGFTGAVIAPMTPAAFINPAVIQRSASLIAAGENRRWRPFRYREGIMLEGNPVSAPARWGIAGALSATQVGMRALARARPSLRAPVARALARVGPASGFGPAADRLENWRWTLDVYARTSGHRQIQVSVEADGHPGYLATARLLGETGILLAQPGMTPERAGCLTPATALGSGCIARFERARMRVARVS